MTDEEALKELKLKYKLHDNRVRLMRQYTGLTNEELLNSDPIDVKDLIKYVTHKY